MATRLFNVRVKRIDLVDRPAIMQTAVLFKQEPDERTDLHMDVKVPSQTAYEAIEAEAARLMKSASNLTPQQAFTKVYKSRPDLRGRYEREEYERKREQLGGNGPTPIRWD